MLKIYLCAFLKQEYLEEAKICIQSIRKHGLFTGKIYLFTDLDVYIDDVIIIKKKCSSVYLSASFRTRLFENLTDISKDDIFLYLDTDIIVMNPIPSFDNIGYKIQVYGYPDRTQKHRCFSGSITNDKKFTSKNAICSGILLFRANNKVKKVFDETYALYLELIKKDKINSCWEQPSLCYKMIEHDMYIMTLNDFVFEEREKFKVDKNNKGDVTTKNKKCIKNLPNNIIFNHFCGLRGQTRYKSMEKYLLNPRKSFKNKKQINLNPSTNITKSIVLTTPEPIVFTTPEPIMVTAQEPIVFTTQEPIVFTTPEPIMVTAQEPIMVTAQEPIVFTTPEPIIKVNELALE